LADVQGQVLEVGGHGFPYGDNGSGAWFGNQLVHHVLLHKDQLGPATKLTDLLTEQLSTNATLDIVANFMHATPTIFAKYAPLVFAAAEQGDEVAQHIVRLGAQHIEKIALRLFSINPPRLSMIGGLAYKVIPYLSAEVQQRICDAVAAPEYGAVWFAQQQRQRMNFPQ
jgi:glucosamine kinase